MAQPNNNDGSRRLSWRLCDYDESPCQFVNLKMCKEMNLVPCPHGASLDAKNTPDVNYDQLGLFQEPTVKNSESAADTGKERCHCMNVRDHHIEDLKSKKGRLEKELRAMECACKQMSEKCQNMESQVDENRNKLQQLAESNDKLCRCLRTVGDQLDEAARQGYNARDDTVYSAKEFEFLKRELENKGKAEEKLRKEKENLSKKLNECGTMEAELTSRITKLNNRIATLEKETASQFKSGDEYKRLQIENEKLLKDIQGLKQRMRDYEANDQASCLAMKRKLDECTVTMMEKEKVITKERDELRGLVEELTNVVKQNKVTLLHLSTINKKQETLIRTQGDQLAVKEEKLRHSEQEKENMRHRTRELDQQVNCLQRAIDAVPTTPPPPICGAKLKSLEILKKELDNAKVALQAEKETTLIKQQIIDDQAKSLCHLKCKLKEKIRELTELQDELMVSSEEVRTLRQDLRRAQHELDIQTREKDSLLVDLQQIEDQKENLTRKVDEMDGLVKRHCQNAACAEKQNQLSRASEQKWEIERKELRTEKDILIKEKNNAQYAAKFATQKLLETVSDFQRQAATHKHVQKTLTDLLQQKEIKLKAVASKMSSITAIAQTAQVEEKRKPNTITELYRRPDRSSGCSCPSTTFQSTTLTKTSSSKPKIQFNTPFDWD